MLSEARKDSARARVKMHTDWLRYHEDMANAERAKIAILTRTWQLCPEKNRVHGEDCCGNPLGCLYAPI